MGGDQSAPDLEIVGGTIVSSAGRYVGSIQVRGGRVVGLSPEPTGSAIRVVDAMGLLVLPGMVDEHVHFMETADPSREDWDHGSAAAATGGVTTVVEHTHAAPVLTAADLREKVTFVTGRSRVDFGLAAHVFPETIGNLGELSAAGIAFVKAFTCTTHGVPGLDPAHVLRLFREAARCDVRVLVHCEDESITAADEQRLRDACREDAAVIPQWRSTEAELSAVAVVAVLARLTGARVTIAHASQPHVVELAQAQRALGAALTIETCPQYLVLDEEEVASVGALRKFTPPARPHPAGEQLWSSLRDGSIDLIAADHAPSTRVQKLTGSIWDCPFGLPGVETVMPIMLSACLDGRLTLEDLVRLYSETPARLLGVYPRKGAILPGSDADLVLIDPTSTRVLRDADVRSKAGWTPFAGMEVAAPPVQTYSRGRLVAEGGAPIGDRGDGAFLRT
jgi:dihydroorotase (multifunctional complex type)